ncbi:MAG: hypothetical protein IT158_24980, partial [Bryobacterales bacterium]|nr:hypothetical protein [Bryobacterales bacterium]
APMRPYNELVHPGRWRAFMEYGNGIIGDMCIHMLDMVRWMLDLGWPKSVSSAGGILANLSMQVGRTLAWDAAKRRVVNDEEANRLLRRPYRKPWVHPEAQRV